MRSAGGVNDASKDESTGRNEGSFYLIWTTLLIISQSRDHYGPGPDTARSMLLHSPELRLYFTYLKDCKKKKKSKNKNQKAEKNKGQ